ncbi:hypothetical protein B7494_g3783 [Chlorociboria aeruginascens]|nr:hypothetical protein B7494_g3783 [Chlorociboria aeruginascens]
MEGHVVQAPNSYLNTLFILNQRRSGDLAEAVPVTVKFGTTLEQIDTLRIRLLDFVTAENREYQKNILTELTTIYEAYSITLNVVFFYKSSWQNELLRLQRRNKFICAMMVLMQELGIEGPRMRLAGAAEEFPMFLHGAYPNTQAVDGNGDPASGPGPCSGSLARDPPFVSESGSQPVNRNPSILRSSSSARRRGESLSAMSKRVDFSLGMAAISSGADFGDVYDDRVKPVLPPTINTISPPRSSKDGRASEDSKGLARTTSRDSQMGRVTSSQRDRSHRNRFFSRGKSKLGIAEEGSSLEDLESGTREFSMKDMPDIPEASGLNSASWEEEPTEKSRMMERVGETSNARIDPRTGIVSPHAVAKDSVLDRGELPIVRPPKRAMTDQRR